jgi:hypothetical protein
VALNLVCDHCKKRVGKKTYYFAEGKVQECLSCSEMLQEFEKQYDLAKKCENVSEEQVSSKTH